MIWNHKLRFIYIVLSGYLILTGCTPGNLVDSDLSSQQIRVVSSGTSSPDACPVTEPEWAEPPDDPAVMNEPQLGAYYINPDRSMWASAWWAESDEYSLRVDKNGVKVAWFRPAGATLEISGQRLDGEAPPLEAYIPCCYSTQFQSSGLFFPTQGCWEITGSAASSELTFVVWVEP